MLTASPSYIPKEQWNIIEHRLSMEHSNYSESAAHVYVFWGGFKHFQSKGSSGLLLFRNSFEIFHKLIKPTRSRTAN